MKSCSLCRISCNTCALTSVAGYSVIHSYCNLIWNLERTASRNFITVINLLAFPFAISSYTVAANTLRVCAKFLIVYEVVGLSLAIQIHSDDLLGRNRDIFIHCSSKYIKSLCDDLIVSVVVGLSQAIQCWLTIC